MHPASIISWLVKPRSISILLLFHTLHQFTFPGRNTFTLFCCNSSNVMLDRSSLSALIYSSTNSPHYSRIIQKLHSPMPTSHSIQAHVQSFDYLYPLHSNVSPSHFRGPIISITQIHGLLFKKKRRLHRRHSRSFRCEKDTRGSSQGHEQQLASSQSDE